MANAHLFPRALVHEIRGDEPEIYIIDKRRQGFRHSQAGIWDPNILCKTHEAALGAGDDYAIRWIRSFDRRAMPIENGLGFQVPNPNPGRLRQFVYSVLWRHTVSDQTPRGDADVGPWERSLRDAIFASGPFRPPFFIARKRWLAGGEHQGDLMVVPHHCPNWGHRAFAFEVGGLLWGVKLDSRSRGAKLFEWPFDAREQTSILALNMGHSELSEDESIMHAFAIASGLAEIIKR